MKRVWVVGIVVLVLVVIAVFVFYPDDVVVGGVVPFRYSSDLDNSSLVIYAKVPLDNESVMEFGRKYFMFWEIDVDDKYDEISSFKEDGLWIFSFLNPEFSYNNGGRVVIDETSKTYELVYYRLYF